MQLLSMIVQDPPRKRTVEVKVAKNGRCYATEECSEVFSQREKHELCRLVHDIAISRGQSALSFLITRPTHQWHATVVDIATPHGVISFGVSMASEQRKLRRLHAESSAVVWSKLSQEEQEWAKTIGLAAAKEFERRSSSLC